MIPCGTPIRFKTFLNKGVSLESIFYSSVGSFLNSLLVGNILIELISYGTPIRFKTLLNKGVLSESIFYSLVGLFFIFFKCSWNLDKKFKRGWYLVIDSSLLSLKLDRRDRFVGFLAFLQ